MSEIDKDYKKAKETLKAVGYAYLFLAFVCINGFATVAIFCLPFLLIKNNILKFVLIFSTSIIILFVNINFLFNTGLEKKYFGTKVKDLPFVEKYSKVGILDDNQIVIRERYDMSSTTDYLITEIQKYRLLSLDEDQLKITINWDQIEELDKMYFNENKIDFIQELIRDGKIDGYSNNAGISFVIDLSVLIFIIFVWYQRESEDSFYNTYKKTLRDLRNH